MKLVYALIGDPVAHSRSPYIMVRAFAAAGVDAAYLAIPVPGNGLRAAIDGLGLMGAGGANVTFPYKEAVIPFLDRVSGEAERIGAVNTLVWDGDGVSGHNTDALGTALALERFAGLSLMGKEVHIFGAGGAARAAAWGVLSRGARGVTFAVRSQDTAEARIAGLREWFRPPIECVAIDDHVAFDVADVIINATPVGMGDDPAPPLVSESWIRPGQCCFDLVYHPRNTGFLEAARARGATTVDGLALLVSQAAESFKLWTGAAFDAEEMATALDAHESGESE